MSKRAEVLGEQLRQIISTSLCFELRDQDLDGVIVTRVKVSPDLQFADVRFNLPDEKPVGKAISAFNRAKGVLKHSISKQVRLRRVPDLRFHLDDDIRAERRIEDILTNLDIPPASETDDN